jgi:hypothetical protein
MGAGIGRFTGKATHERDSTAAMDDRQLSSNNANPNFAADGGHEQSWYGPTKTY